METIKKALLKLVSFGENLEGSLKDNKITLLEGATLAGALGLAVFYIIQNFQSISAELAAVDQEKEAELKAFLEQELKLDSEKAEKLFLVAFDLLFTLLEFVDTLRQK